MEKIRLSIATTDKLGKPEYQYQYFYRAADVDALLQALVEAAKATLEPQDTPCRLDHHGLCQEHNLRRNEAGDPECQVPMLRKAIAAVERHFSNKNSKP